MTLDHKIVHKFLPYALLIGCLLPLCFFFTYHKTPHDLDIPSEQNVWAAALARLPSEDKTSLTRYFRAMLLDSEGGYVLFGTKPVCLEALANTCSQPDSNYVFPYRSGMVWEDMRRGLEVWSRIPFSKQTSNVLIVCYDHPDFPCKDSRHVLWIHRQAFLKVVNENLTLFQATLGPQVTAEALLEELSDPKASFWSTLVHNKILIGILLGFGTQNAIFHDRLERVDVALSQLERPPLAPRAFRAGIDESGIPASHLMTRFSSPLGESELRVSFGFTNLSEEREFLRHEMSSSRDLVPLVSPCIPLFSCQHGNRETLRLLQGYADVQSKIKDLLSSDDFLEQIFALILGDRPRQALTVAHEPYSLPRSVDDAMIRLKKEPCSGQLVSYIGQVIRKNLIDDDPSYIAMFIAGMKDAEKDSDEKRTFTDVERRQKMQPILDSVLPTRVRHARDNLQEGDQALNLMAQEPNVVELVPGKLYYKIKQQGHGPLLTKDDLPTVQYTLSYLTGKKKGRPIACSAFSELNSAELISGFAHGMLGMHVGEVREIYIHSDLAYGCRSRFEAGVAMMAKVELLSLRAAKEGSLTPFPSVVAVDQGIPGNLVVSDDIDLLTQQVAYTEGYVAWSFYRLGHDFYSLEELVDSLQVDYDKEMAVDQAERQSILNDLFIVLYHRAFQSDFNGGN